VPERSPDHGKTFSGRVAYLFRYRSANTGSRSSSSL
jgi:hypothetical protein